MRKVETLVRSRARTTGELSLDASRAALSQELQAHLMRLRSIRLGLPEGDSVVTSEVISDTAAAAVRIMEQLASLDMAECA